MTSICRGLRMGMATAVLLAGAACSGTVDTHGHVLREETTQQIQPGLQTREDVLRLLGTPSSRAAFDDNTWYYIGEKTESLAFFKPDLMERKVLVVRFDNSGHVTSAKALDAEDRQEVALVSRETPTAGHELGLLEQLLGNIGRFNSGAGAKSGGAFPGPNPSR